MEKKHVLILVYCWRTGGVENVTATLGNGLCGEYDIHIGVLEEICDNAYQLDAGVEFFSFHGDRGWMERLDECVRMRNIELIILQSHMVSAFYQVILRYAKQIPCIVYAHENYFLPTPRWEYQYGTQRFYPLQQAAAVAWEPGFAQRLYNYTNDNGVVMPNANGFEAPLFAERECASGRIAAIARWDDPKKRIDRILHTFALVAREDETARLTVIGPYNLGMRFESTECGDVCGQTLKQYLDSLGSIRERITFTDKVTYTQCASRLQEADILIHASESEGFGLVITEAAACGVPAVVCGFPGVSELIDDGISGYIVRQGDVKGMAEHVLTLLHDDALYSRMRRNAYAMAERFSQQRFCERWGSLIELVLQRPTSLALKPFRSEASFDERDIESIVCQYEYALSQAWVYTARFYDTKAFRRLYPLYQRIKNSIDHVLHGRAEKRGRVQKNGDDVQRSDG